MFNAKLSEPMSSSMRETFLFNMYNDIISNFINEIKNNLQLIIDTRTKANYAKIKQIFIDVLMQEKETLFNDYVATITKNKPGITPISTIAKLREDLRQSHIKHSELQKRYNNLLIVARTLKAKVEDLEATRPSKTKSGKPLYITTNDNEEGSGSEYEDDEEDSGDEEEQDQESEEVEEPKKLLQNSRNYQSKKQFDSETDSLSESDEEPIREPIKTVKKEVKFNNSSNKNFNVIKTDISTKFVDRKPAASSADILKNVLANKVNTSARSASTSLTKNKISNVKNQLGDYF